MSEAHGDAHGAEHGKDEHAKSGGSGLEQLVGPTISAAGGAGLTYIAMGTLTAAPIIAGGAVGLGAYYIGKFFYDKFIGGDKKEEHGAHAEPAHAGAGGHH